MIFTSFEFVCFFVVVLLSRKLISNFNTDKWFLLAASYIFYMSWSVPCVLLILFSSFIDFRIGALLGTTDEPRSPLGGPAVVAPP